MDILLKMLAMLTLIWGGWMYFKSSDDEAKLRGIRNELKVAKQELGDARAAYEEESKKCETLAGEIDTLKENAQELRKGITAKREEKKKLAAQERQEQLEAERKAREEAAEARREKLRIQKEKEQEQEQENRMALLEREKQFEKEEEQKEKEQAAEYEKEERKERIQQLKRRIESSTRGLESYSSCSAYAPPGKKDFGQVEKMRQNWTSFVRSCIEAVDKGDSNTFEKTGKKLLNTARALDRICDGHHVSDATNFVADGRKILGVWKELQELEKLNKSES